MKIIKYDTLPDLQQSALLLKQEVYETFVSYSFRIFENKNTKELHVFYK